MENGVEIDDQSHLREGKYTRDDEEQVENKDLNVLHRSRDSEGDEVFEEAIDHIPEQPVQLDIKNVKEDVDPDPLPDNVLADEHSDVKEFEGEVFVEAIDALDDAANGGFTVMDERTDCVANLEDGETLKDFASDDLTESGNKEDISKELNVDTVHQRELLENMSKAGEESSIDLEKSMVANNEAAETQEYADDTLAGEDAEESNQEVGPNGDVVHQDDNTEAFEDNHNEPNHRVAGDILNFSEVNGRANTGAEQEDGEIRVKAVTSGHLEPKDDSVAEHGIKHQVELNQDAVNLNCAVDLGTEKIDGESRIPEVSSSYFEVVDDNGELVQESVVERGVELGEMDVPLDEASSGLDSRGQDEEENSLKGTVNSLDSDGPVESGAENLPSAGCDSGVQGDPVDDSKDTLNLLDSEHEVENGEGNGTSACIEPIDFSGETKKLEDTAAQGRTPGSLTSEDRSMSTFADGSNDIDKRTQDGAFCSTEGDTDKECNGHQPSPAVAENGDTTRKYQADSVSLEVKKEATKEEKQDIQENGKQEIGATSRSASLSGISENITTLPRPAGLGRSASPLEPAPRLVQQSRVNGSVSQGPTQLSEETANGETEENDETREKLQMIRVKFLRLAHRLGQTPHNVVVAQVLYRLGLAEQLRGRNGGRVGAFSFDRASAMAEQLEAAGQEPLDFSCTIMVLGKTGVGKSATINSIFDEVKFGTDAFQSGTKKVQDVVGTVQGIKVRVIDTPGLLPSWSDQRQNEKILLSVKRFIKKTPPDIVLYLDRLDMQSRDFGDMPLLRTITDIFGPSIWFNAIVVLTHAASAPPDGPNGTASSYDMFVTQRSHVVQQAIRQAAGDMRLMNPVSLVENHSACRTNRAGQRVLPNGQIWKPHLLLLSFASKILAEANTLLKLQDSPPGRPFASRSRAPPLPFLLSSLLQSRPQLKLPEEQFGDEDTLDDDLDESSDSDDESEYDELPPFKRLTKAQLNNLTKAQRKAYFDELEYRENLFMKKQLKEEKRRRRMLKKMEASARDSPVEYTENAEEESGAAASVPVPMPDLALPASFDSDNPTHRYRYLDSSNQWLVRPVLETHGWDHDVGYEGINVEKLFVVSQKVPVSFSGQVTKDKKDANLQLEVASSIKHGEGKATSLGFDMQTVGKDISYTLRSETRLSNHRRNKAAAGLSVTLLGDALSAGVKVEDKLIATKRFRMVMTGGAMTSRGDVAYGGSLEATLRDRDYPLGRSLSTFGLSVMDWHGDLAIGCNMQSQIPVGRHTNMIARFNLNNRGAGQVSIRFNSSEQLQIALVGLVPLFQKLLGYSQQMQFGQ